jgi:dGTPase
MPGCPALAGSGVRRSKLTTIGSDPPFALDSVHALDFLKWDGNAQTIRLVAKLQVLADEYGLNLTCGTLSAACKYLAPADGIDKRRHELTKIGYFTSEADLIKRLREVVGTADARNPLTFLVEASDDIVYSTVDLEDAIKKKPFDGTN